MKHKGKIWGQTRVLQWVFYTKNLDSEKDIGESVALIIFKQGIAAEQRKPTGAL